MPPTDRSDRGAAASLPPGSLPPRSPWTEGGVRSFRSALLGFFRERRRALPWRETSDPYRILVSEVMLQQTRVEAVVPYYRRWMARFPDPGSLAEADLDEVLGMWQGLGYYSRARNLHRAVREVVRRHDGEVPEAREELRKLPGIGPYTAGAVASMAFGQAVPAVDGNVRRVLARLMDEPSPRPAELEKWAAALVDPECPGDFNQALMELGSLVCTPRSPSCEECPVERYCAARAAGSQEERPAPRARTPAPLVDEAVAVLVGSGPSGPSVLLRRRPEDGLLGGMWELPGTRFGDGVQPRDASAALARELLGVSGASEHETEKLPTVKHAFSHRRMRYHPFLFWVAGPKVPKVLEPLRWVDLDDLGAVALPAAQRRILESLAAASHP